MTQVTHAIDVFVGHLTAISWRPLVLALVCQLVKTLARTRAQRNILAAAYPTGDVRWCMVFGAYVAGSGVNALIPVRGGDLAHFDMLPEAAGVTRRALPRVLGHSPPRRWRRPR